MKPSGRRRGFSSWFVEPHRQVKLGLMFLLLNLSFSMVILGVFGFYFWDVYSTVATYFKLTTDQSSQVLDKFLPPMFIALTLTVLFVVVSILLSVRYTHRIYGPLVSIHRYLDDFLEGRSVTPLNLRESDQLKELAEKLNELAKRFPLERRENNFVPIFQFIDQLNEGEQPDKLSLRGGDQLDALAGKLNQLAEKYAKK
ncbi:hypothetical protein [Pseudobacteriovorax antillogorgiicola]|uniref:HAMP domain-containing protein n=1 Tax=Pseudobacteriovorax antillogorgiicola TaxID=1513793 RepID=A0A1Y6B2L6_9BACT|nr:hypothetical protein [Pseudobacteriovorax antillogorgiicola]TCS59442.1 hypothetical protein EDD56_101353 [Pseudobacteriovorax antillogorgiicola]SME88256.1 hypothetical protein SAMN06296036_101132 [Pseudobacteriovorax antillogorgiicola]